MTQKKKTLPKISRGASNFKKKLLAQLETPTPVTEDLVEKAVELWDAWEATSKMLQEYLDQYGTFCVTSKTGTIKLHPLCEFQKTTLQNYLKVLDVLGVEQPEVVPQETDELSDFMEGK